MILEKIVVENFMSFYGRHVLSLERGLNFVVGPGGSGKTALVMAFRFVFAGRNAWPYSAPLNRLINRKHREEVANPSCRVEVEIEHEGRKWHAVSSLSLDGDKAMQSSEMDLGLDESLVSRKLKNVIVNPIILHKMDVDYLSMCSASTRMNYAIRKQLDLNLKADIKMVIIDGTWGWLNPQSRTGLLRFIDDLPMEQVIIMVKSFPDYIENYPHAIHQIEHDHETNSSRIAGSRICRNGKNDSEEG